MPTPADVARRAGAWACYDCGKCTATCPLARAGAPYSPRRQVLRAAAGEAPEDGSSLHACLTCGACEARCPARVRYTELVLGQREVGREGRPEPDCPHGGALQSAMRMMARGTTRLDRLGWLTPDLRTVPDRGALFLWVGCTPLWDAFFDDARTLEGSRAAVRVLNRLGVEPVVSGDERCCGHDLLWSGDRASFEALARHNTALVEASGAATLVVPCAECLRTWRLDCAPFFHGKPPRIVHFSEIVAERAADLGLRRDAPERRLTLHDPCRLSRHLGESDAPRRALAAVPGALLAEMPRSAGRSACCAGGTWSNCDRYAKRIQVERLLEARRTGAGVLVTACPKCQVHLRCAMKDPRTGDETAIEMRDVAEIVAEALE